MLPRWRLWLLWCVVFVAAAADDSPQGLVSTNEEQDLVAEASNNSPQAQKREAGLSNSYGEPLPSDAYGPPNQIQFQQELHQPAPIYGVPDFGSNLIQTPPGAYGPPAPVVFPSQIYDGPPPPPLSKPKPLYGPPKLSYGPPKQFYGPPKQLYGPPKKIYGPPKQSLPKTSYGLPFKQKISFPKPVYGVPKQHGPPKPIYGPPKQSYGPPLNNPIPLQELPAVSLPQNFGNNIELNLPAPIYGTPISSDLDIRPNFPIPSDTYGPPGHSLGPVGPNDQVVVHEESHIAHGPPQPDPNPQPPYPGIPAPPTPPHVMYDGWKPIPGVSHPPIEQQQQQHHHHIEDEYGPPPPVQDLNLNLDGHSLPGPNHAQFSGAQVSTSYSLHQEALGGLDLNSLIGGDSNNIDPGKNIFEAHFTENHNNNQDISFNIPSGLGKPIESYGAPPIESLSLSSGPYPPPSIRQHGAKGLVPPSGIYGVPPGSQYGAPPKPPPSHLPLPYGSYSGGGHSIHTGGTSPKHPIKFREPVPDGLIQQIGHITHHKDHHGSDHHIPQGPVYIPPPIRDIKDHHHHHHGGNHGHNSLSLSIEPSNLFSLPHSGNPISFQNQAPPSNLYGSPLDSYSVPLFTVSDHSSSDSNVNEVKASIDGTILSNLSSQEIAAILKHCPYHEAILKAAQSGEKIPSELASSYVASLSSLGSMFHKNQFSGNNNDLYNSKDLSSSSQNVISTIVSNDDGQFEKREKNQKSMKDETGKYVGSQDDLQLVSDQILKTSEKISKLSEETKKLQQKIVSTSQNLNQVNGQISQSNETPIRGNGASYSVQIQSANGAKGSAPTIPHEHLLSEGLLSSILSAIDQPSSVHAKQREQNNFGQSNNANYASLVQSQSPQSHSQNSHSHTQFSFAQSLPNPSSTVQTFNSQNFGQHNFNTFNGQPSFSFSSIDDSGLILPMGYEPIDRTKDKPVITDQEIQGSHKDIQKMLNKEIIHHHHHHRGDIPECDLKADNSITHTIVVPPPNVNNIPPVDEIDENDVAIYFDEKSDSEQKKDSSEPVTEIFVATSISEDMEDGREDLEFGEKIKNKS